MKTKRKELKLCLSNIEKINFISSFRGELKPIFEERTITSLYFDSINFSLYKRSRSFDVDKYKIRFRTYSNSKQIIQEIKYTNSDSKFKRFLKTDFKSFDDINKFNYDNLTLLPTLFVSYSRSYFTYKDTRVTVDKNISFKSHQYRTLAPVEYFPNNLNVIEFKLFNETKDIEKYIKNQQKSFQNMSMEFIKYLI